MKKENLSQNKNLLFLFFESILEIINEFSLNSDLLAKICILFNFTHTFSYLCSIFMRDTEAESATAVFQIIYFSNYMNLIHLTGSFWLKLTIFIILQIAISFTLLYFSFYWFFSYFFKKSKAYFRKINKIVGGFCSIYNWIIFIPALDLFINVFDCNSTHQEIFGKFNCFDNFILYLFSILGTIFSIILGALLLYIDRDFVFLDTSSLKFNLNLNIIICFIIKIIEVAFFKYFHDYEWIYIILLLFYCIFILSFYLEQIPFRNERSSLFFLTNIVYFFLLLIIFILWRVGLLYDDDLIFYASIFIVLIIKLSVKTYDYLIYCNIMNKSLFEKKIIFLMEEMIRLFYEKKLGDSSTFLFHGYFRNHYKYCKDSDCLNYKKNFANFSELDFTPQSQTFKKFINENLFIFAKKIFLKKDDITNQQEIHILKLLTFLLAHGTNPMRTYYETLKILNQSSMFSFYFLTISNYLKAQIKIKIQSILRESNQDLNSASQNKIDVNEFFSSYKLKRKLEKDIKILLTQKLDFFENLKKGISGMDGLYDMMIDFAPKINNFKKKLDSMKKYRTSFFLMIRFKFSAILDCVVLNYFMKAIKNEEEFFALMQKSIQLSSQVTFDLNFFSNNLIVCEASFLHNAGQLTEGCKTGKFRNFFGYSPNAMIDKLNYVEDLMPEFIRLHHLGFLTHYLNKEKEELRGRKIDIESFVLTKEGFVFPMKSLIGYNLSLDGDFVLIAALKNMAPENYVNILCDFNGNIHNVSKDFFEMFKQEYDFLMIKDFSLLNIFNFIPSLSQTIDNNLKEKNNKQLIVKNLNGMIVFPSKMKRLVEFMRNKKREESESERYSARSFSKQNVEPYTNKPEESDSPKNLESIKKKSIKSKQSKKLNMTNSSAGGTHQKAFFEDDTSTSKFANINYDLIIKSHHYGQDNKSLEYIAVVISKIWWPTIKTIKSPSSCSEKIGKNSNKEVKAKETIAIESSGILFETIIAPIRLPDENETQMKKIFEREVEPPEVKKIILQTPLDNNNTLRPKTLEMKSIIIEERESLKSEEKNKASVSEINNRNANVEVRPKTNKEEREGSQLSSSRDSAKKIFLLYASIGEIEKMNPWSLLSSSISILIQILISIVYCIVFYTTISNYITNYHEPTSKSMMDFSKQISNVGFGTMVSLELEYYYLGLIGDEDKDLFYELLKEINKNSLEIVRTINYEERDAQANLEHQMFYKTLVIQVVDDQDLTMVDVRFIDFVDQLVYKMNRNAKILDTRNFGKITYDSLINMQKNYVYFLQANSLILNIFQANFFKYNDETSSLVQNYLIIFLLLYFFVKLFEFNQWLKYQAMIEKILMIFLRINSHEIFCIHHCTEEILKILKDPSEKYLHTNIPEAYLESNSNKELIESKSLKDAKGKKKNLDLTFRGFKGLSKTKIYVYFLTVSGIMLFYFFFNFYYWMQNNVNIKNLIQLDSFFLKIYIYSTSTLCTNNLLIRQNIISNPSYQKIDDPLQKKETRHIFLQNALNLRMETIQNVTANQLLQTGLEAKSKLNNPFFDQILNGDLCQVLRDENEMNLNLEGTSLTCENLFNSGFINGIANAENEYIRLLKAYKEVYTKDVDTNDLENIEKQKEMIYRYLYDASHMEILIGDYFLSKSLSIFYGYINEFYNDLLIVDIKNLDMFSVSSLSIVVGLNALIMIYINTVIRKKYKSLTLIISLIPFERLVNDEQTGYLIKKFLKEYEQ